MALLSIFPSLASLPCVRLVLRLYLYLLANVPRQSGTFSTGIHINAAPSPGCDRVPETAVR